MNADHASVAIGSLPQPGERLWMLDQLSGIEAFVWRGQHLSAMR